MPFLHTLIKYAADRGGLAGRVADVGLRAMKKRCVAVLTAALCLMLVLGLQACAGSGGGRPIQDPQAGTVLPEGAKKEEGVVLDLSLIHILHKGIDGIITSNPPLAWLRALRALMRFCAWA